MAAAVAITASIAIFTSFCSIFLPKYSGVRPTIKSGDENGHDGEQEHSVQSSAHAAEDHFTGLMLNRGTKPPIGVKLSCMPMTAPQLASVVMVANRAVAAMPKRVSFPSMFPPGLMSRGRGIPAPSLARVGLPDCSAQ